jgi:glycosyltransferase involved in cell wall biosynthesis
MSPAQAAENINQLNRKRAAMAGPFISLCMIVKNEELRLPRCLESVRGLVDEYVIVDTGSTDRTKEIAKSFGAKVLSFAWSDDFSEARNESLRHAKGDWIIFLDADETLNRSGESDCLKKAASAPGIDAYYVPILNPDTNHGSESTVGSAVRFFRKYPGIRFAGRVHESVDRFLSGVGARAARSTFIIEHYGYGLDRDIVRKKYERNLNLLEKELEENPSDANVRYHLGLTCMALERDKEALEAFERALSGTGLTTSLEAMILNMKSYHLLRAGEIDAADEACSRSLALVPVQNTARLLKGLASFYGHAYGDALPLLLDSYRFISLPPQERESDIFFEDSIGKSSLIEIIGTCFCETGHFAEAIPFLKLTAHLKNDPASFERLGICLLNMGDFSGAVEYLEKARAGTEHSGLALPLSFACFRTGDFRRAADHFRCAKPGDDNEVAVAFQLLQAMASEDSFRPWLSDCIQSKLDLFRRAFPEDFPRFLMQTEKTGLSRKQHPARLEEKA